MKTKSQGLLFNQPAPATAAQTKGQPWTSPCSMVPSHTRHIKECSSNEHFTNIARISSCHFVTKKKKCNCCLFIYMIERLWQVRWLLQFFYDAQNILNKTSSIILITSKVSSLTSYIAISSNSPLFIVSLLHLQALQHAFFYIILFSKSIVN